MDLKAIAHHLHLHRHAVTFFPGRRDYVFRLGARSQEPDGLDDREPEGLVEKRLERRQYGP